MTLSDTFAIVHTSTATAVVNSGKATKGIIMSKAKSTSVVVVVSTDDFNTSLGFIKAQGTAVRSQLLTACLYVAQCANVTSQKAAKKAVALAYQAFQVSITGLEYKTESATRWVENQVKKVAPVGFKWHVSKTANAVAKATKAKATKAKVTVAKAKPEPKQTITQLRDAWVAKEKFNLDAYRNYIPAGKIQLVEQATMAYIQTLQMLLA